jgi:hypothetical protein
MVSIVISIFFDVDVDFDVDVHVLKRPPAAADKNPTGLFRADFFLPTQ